MSDEDEIIVKDSNGTLKWAENIKREYAHRDDDCRNSLHSGCQSSRVPIALHKSPQSDP